MLSPSLFPRPENSSFGSSITSCKKCDICRNFLVCDNKFKCRFTNKTYRVKGDLNCNSPNIVYLISCSNCKDQYVGSAKNFKNRFRVHKSDINTNKDRCGTARHFNNKCKHPELPTSYLKIQLIESAGPVSDNSEEVLWYREKYSRPSYLLTPKA